MAIILRSDKPDRGKMSPREILFHSNGHFKSPDEISERIKKFGNSYSNTINSIMNILLIVPP